MNAEPQVQEITPTEHVLDALTEAFGTENVTIINEFVANVRVHTNGTSQDVTVTMIAY